MTGLLTGRGGGRRMDKSGWSKGVTGQGASGARIRPVRPGVRTAGMGCGRNVRCWVSVCCSERASDGRKK